MSHKSDDSDKIQEKSVIYWKEGALKTRSEVLISRGLVDADRVLTCPPAVIEFDPQEIFQAVRQGDATKVSQILKNHPSASSICEEEGYDWTPLHWAVLLGRRSISELLISAGADVDARARGDAHRLDSDFDNHHSQKAPIHFAAIKNKLECVEILLAAGADINARDFYKRTALSIAANDGHVDIVKYLLDNGAVVNWYGEPTMSPLHHAAQEGHVEIVSILLAKGADIDARCYEGKTPLHDAVEQKNEQIVEMLIGAGADVNAVEESGETPLHGAALCGNSSIAELLITNGAYIETSNDKGITPLHFASIGLHPDTPDTVETLLAHGANVNCRDYSGRTALHLVVTNTDYLLHPSSNPKLNRWEKMLEPDEIMSQAKIRRNVVEILLNHGAQKNVKDDLGFTPLSLAKALERNEIYELLDSNLHKSREKREGRRLLKRFRIF